MVKGQPELEFQIETEWIRNYAKTYLPSEAGFAFLPSMMRKRGFNIIQVRHVMKTGRVVYSEKLNEPGAEWIVVGHDQDGARLRLELVVVSDVQKVVLRDVSADDDRKEDGNDAA